MNGLQRLDLVIKGVSGDRCPVFLTASLYGAAFHKQPLNLHYTDYKTYVSGQRAVADEINPDILMGPFFLAAEASAFGSTVEFIKNSAPNISKYADINVFVRVPDIEKNPYLSCIIESVQHLSHEFRFDKPVAAVCLNPVDLPILILGMEQWLQIFLFDPERADAMIRTTTEFYRQYVEKLKDAGAAFLVSPFIFSNPYIMTENMIYERVVEYLKDFFSLEIPIIIHHGGAPICKWLNYFSEYTAAAGFVVEKDADLDQARKTIESKILCGNIDSVSLKYFTEKQTQNKVQTVLENRKNDSSFVLATSNADIPLETPLKNLQAFMEAADG